MAFKLFSDVRETSTTGGTGDQILDGALDGSYFPFSARYSVGDTCFYCLKQGNSREIGLGTYASGNKLSRTQVYKSTNANNLVNFAAGIIDIFVTNIAPDDLDAAGKASLLGTLGLVKQSSLDDATVNRVMMTGAFGLGGTTRILTGGVSAIADRPTGFYYFNDTADAPTINYGWLNVFKVDSSYRVLEFIDASTGYHYWGQVFNSVWSGWRLVDARSGTNGTGDWIKAPGGWMTSRQRISASGFSWSGAAGFWYVDLGSFSFPAAFSATPKVFAQPIDGDIGSRMASVPYLSANTSGITSLYLASFLHSAPGTGSISIDLFAAGAS